MLGIRRRDFITLLGGAVAWPLAARAQQRTLPTVGLLFSGTPETNGDEVTALRRGMSETGFVEGRNVAVEYRWGWLPAVGAGKCALKATLPAL
jgi:putative ABC transport system substrate-binding protein